MTEELKSLRILVLDEDRPLIAELQQEAARYALVLETAFTPTELHQKLDRSPIDAVVMPARMSGANGLQLLDELQQRWPQLAVLLTTGIRSSSLMRLAARHGARALLSKPLVLSRLALEVRGAYAEQTRSVAEPLTAWDTSELRDRLMDIHLRTGLVLSLATLQGTILRTIGQRNVLCGLVRSNPKHLATICQTVSSAMSAELAVERCVLSELCDAGMRRVVLPIFDQGKMVGQVTGCGVATDPGEPAPELLSVQLGIEAERAHRLAGRVHRERTPDLLRAIDAVADQLRVPAPQAAVATATAE